MSNQIPERLINYKVYKDGTTPLGVATVDLPDIESMTDTVTGAGIAGEIDSPTLGHFGSMGLTLNWRTLTGDATSLAAPQSHHLEFRGSIQVNDAGNGIIKTAPVRVVTRCTPKRIGLGSLEVAAAMDASNEFEVTYLKLFVGGVERLEIDKYNFVYKVNGVDHLASVRKDLGL